MNIFTKLWILPASCVGLFLSLLYGRMDVSTLDDLKLIRVRRLFPSYASAQTHGNVILYRGKKMSVFIIEHETVHVRQYMRWGIFFYPAYALCSIWAFLKGESPYFDNCFEKEAYKDK